MTDLLVRGMHGLGDNLHQRALLRQLIARGETVHLETSWASLYHDLTGPRLTLLRRPTTLRTQSKNAAREAALFSERPAPPAARALTIGYAPEACRRSTVLGAMCQEAGCDVAGADFRLPIPPEWHARADVWLRHWRPSKPLLIHRPLVERQEWGGCAARNPDRAAYDRLFAAVRDQFFVVSVADADQENERVVSLPIAADATCHGGELDFETLAALTRRASLVYCSPGFALILAQAVGTPTLAVFGGYESAARYLDTARHAPFLGIDPLAPCDCYRHDHACPKAIDLGAALPEAIRFAGAAARGFRADRRPEAVVAPAAGERLGDLPTRYLNPGELETLIALVRGVAPKRVIEFGCNEGRTAAALLRAVPSIEHYIGVDVTPGHVSTLEAQRAETPALPGWLALDDPRFELRLERDGTRDIGCAELPPCDALFIDGDHSRAGVLHDTALARDAVRPGGIVLWHDDNGGDSVPVSAALDEMYAYHEADPTHVRGTWIAFERIAALNFGDGA